MVTPPCQYQTSNMKYPFVGDPPGHLGNTLGYEGSWVATLLSMARPITASISPDCYIQYTQLVWLVEFNLYPADPNLLIPTDLPYLRAL